MSDIDELKQILDIIIPRDGEIEGMTAELHDKAVETAKTKINRLIDDAVIGFASELKESFRGKIIPYKNDGERQIVEQAYHDWTNAIDDALSNNLSKGGV